MVVLTKEQIDKKLDFIEQYKNASNASTGSTMDANANVENKNIATLSAELNKDINIQINRALLDKKIEELFGKDLADEYIRQLESHEIYCHDESNLAPYCVSVSMYPFLLNGLKDMGGESKPPKHLNSFCGSFINLVFSLASQFSGAVATVEFLNYFDYFARNEYGDDYLETHKDTITQELQSVVYALNQPASARNYQSVFWNISVFDKEYFDGIFGDFVFPDFTKSNWDTLSKLQDHFMSWFNEERTKAVLTFPVVTATILNDGEKETDEKFVDMLSKELSEGNSFFMYTSESADSLASCCRMKNELQSNDFSYSLGAGGVSTGSKNVMTINMNSLVQEGRDLKEQVEKIHKYQVAYDSIMHEYFEAGLLPAYSGGFIALEKQYLTLGLCGILESAEFLGIKVSNNDDYKNYVQSQLKVIYDTNREGAKKYDVLFNTEIVPAENLGSKFAKWDKKKGLEVPRDCYNSYFYIVEDSSVTVLDKFELHGTQMVENLDGGSALHLNLEEHLSKEAYKKLIRLAILSGTNYFTTNVKVTICNEEGCECIDKRTLQACPKCGSKNIDYGTRVIGYLKRTSAFSEDRQIEESKRHYNIH